MHLAALHSDFGPRVIHNLARLPSRHREFAAPGVLCVHTTAPDSAARSDTDAEVLASKVTEVITFHGWLWLQSVR